MATFTSGKISHDPEPWLSKGRVEFRTETEWGACHYAPRPEFDNHNPILVNFRQAHAMWAVEGDSTLADSARECLHWFEDPDYVGDHEHVEHARRVLTLIITRYEER